MVCKLQEILEDYADCAIAPSDSDDILRRLEEAGMRPPEHPDDCTLNEWEDDV